MVHAGPKVCLFTSHFPCNTPAVDSRIKADSWQAEDLKLSTFVGDAEFEQPVFEKLPSKGHHPIEPMESFGFLVKEPLLPPS